MTEQEIQSILEKQRAFFAEGKTLDLDYREKALKRLRQVMARYEIRIAEALRTDLGKSRMEDHMCEYGLTLSELTWMQKHLKRLVRDIPVRTPLTSFPARSFRSPRPYGTVLIMSPWNYPVLLTLEPLIDALAAGNTAVVKPSAYSAATSAVLKEMLDDAFPDQYVAVVSGGREENQALLHQKFDKIFFTGGKNVGREVLICAAEHLTPVTLELGGKSPCIIDSSANLSLAARRIVWGKYLNCGQTCVAPDYIICPPSVREELIRELRREISRQFGSDPISNPHYGKIINEKHFDRLLGLMDEDKVVCGGESDRELLKISPTVMADVTWDDAVMGEEIFGPILPILTCSSLDAAIEAVNSRPHPLALYLFTQRRSAREKVLRDCQFGGGCINDVVVHLATSGMPFGGVGESGMGAYHGKAGFETFSHYRSIADRKTWLDVPMRYQPYNKFNEKLLRFFLK